MNIFIRGRMYVFPQVILQTLKIQYNNEGGNSMELTDNLKGKLEEAKNEEEAKKILEETKKNVEDAGVVLDDAELDKAAGGKFWRW